MLFWVISVVPLLWTWLLFYRYVDMDNYWIFIVKLNISTLKHLVIFLWNLLFAVGIITLFPYGSHVPGITFALTFIFNHLCHPVLGPPVCPTELALLCEPLWDHFSFTKRVHSTYISSVTSIFISDLSYLSYLYCVCGVTYLLFPCDLPLIIFILFLVVFKRGGIHLT